MQPQQRPVGERGEGAWEEEQLNSEGKEGGRGLWTAPAGWQAGERGAGAAGAPPARMLTPRAAACARAVAGREGGQGPHELSSGFMSLKSFCASQNAGTHKGRGAHAGSMPGSSARQPEQPS